MIHNIHTDGTVGKTEQTAGVSYLYRCTNSLSHTHTHTHAHTHVHTHLVVLLLLESLKLILGNFNHWESITQPCSALLPQLQRKWREAQSEIVKLPRADL